MNDCQIQTEDSLDSKESLSESRLIELQKLQLRLANIEGILEQKDESIADVVNICNNYEFSKNSASSQPQLVHAGIQASLDIPTFSQPEIDSLVHKLK